MNNNDKVNTIIDRVMQIILSLPNEQANLLSFALEPHATAVGANFYYNRDQVRGHLTDSLKAGIDKNSQYTLNRVYDKVTKGQL